MTSERWLKLVLRLGGVLTGSAVFAVFLPTRTMVEIHRQLGLGELPVVPMTEYLTRSLSAMYALHGLVLLALSIDVRRHLGVVTCLGWGTAALGLAQLGIDLRARLPTWWTAVEGPWVFVAGLAIVWLGARVRAERGERAMAGIPLKRAEQGKAGR